MRRWGTCVAFGQRSTANYRSCLAISSWSYAHFACESGLLPLIFVRRGVIYCNAVARAIAALLGRFLPRLGPLASRERPFFCVASRCALPASCPALGRASTPLRATSKAWMAGTSPAVTGLVTPPPRDTSAVPPPEAPPGVPPAAPGRRRGGRSCWSAGSASRPYRAPG